MPRNLRRLIASTFVLSALLIPTAHAGHVPPPGDPFWVALAECESGGNPHTNTGNGFLGGLQWLPSTWRAAGGQGSPVDASLSTEIAVAHSWAHQTDPRTQWPTCWPIALAHHEPPVIVATPSPGDGDAPAPPATPTPPRTLRLTG